jgi:hypothetical protein
MRSVAETGRVPPGSGVSARAVVLPAGFRTVGMDLVTVVSTSTVAVVCDVPVACPATVWSRWAPLTDKNS